MILEPEQIVYNTQYYQNLEQDNIGSLDPSIYLTRLLNYNNKVLANNYGGYYDIVLDGNVITNISLTESNLSLIITKGKIIIDSTLIITEDDINLSLDLTSAPKYNSIIIAAEYKFNLTPSQISYNLFLYNDIDGKIFPSIWDENKHYFILNLFNIDYDTLKIYKYSKHPTPEFCRIRGTNDVIGNNYIIPNYEGILNSLDSYENLISCNDVEYCKNKLDEIDINSIPYCDTLINNSLIPEGMIYIEGDLYYYDELNNRLYNKYNGYLNLILYEYYYNNKVLSLPNSYQLGYI